MGAQILSTFPALQLTVTDLDESMLVARRGDLAAFGVRGKVVTADATHLEFPSDSFDFVFSFLMLHHVIEWESALAEAIRVLRPQGELIGYDFLDSWAFRLFHRIERAEVRLMTLDRLTDVVDALPVDRVQLTTGFAHSIVRFKVRKAPASSA